VKMEIDTKSRQGQINYVMDLELIEMIHSLPSLDPFLFKSKAEQLDLLDRIHPNYFAIGEKEWERIRRPIRNKILKLVKAAFGEAAEADNKRFENLANRFLDKIWEAKDIRGIEDFVRSMDISPEQAPELFFAWKAVCFYQDQFDQQQNEYHAFFDWLADETLSLPLDIGRLPRSERERMAHNVTALRGRIRQSHQKVVGILMNYEESYQRFVERHEPKGFKDFLGSAERHYQEIAACLSAATHATKVWREITERHGEHLNTQNYRQLLSTLSVLFDAKIHANETRAAS
jgi:hypothetical protein